MADKILPTKPKPYTPTHRLSFANIYRRWIAMKSRCETITHSSYPNYGGRGIKVCERWQSFENFYADMGDVPEGMFLDRIDNNGNYEPSNCRWVTKIAQDNNRRTNVTIEFGGESMTITEWRRKLGITRGAMQHRLNAGWSMERIVSTPQLSRN
jgi:hypothetical protein